MEIVIQLIILGITGIICVLSDDLHIACFALGGCAILLCLLSAIARYRREKWLEELALYLMKLQDHSEFPELSKYSEGQLGVLQSEIYKLVMQLRETSSGAVREKEYLAGMLSDISHQIKTPLTSIISYVQFLKQEEGLPDHVRDYVTILDEKSQRLKNMVQDVFAVSKAASGELPGGLRIERKAKSIHDHILVNKHPEIIECQRVCSYAYAVSEQNAGNGLVVTAPTCGACGVVPAVLRYAQVTRNFTDQQICRGLAAAGIIGNLTKTNFCHLLSGLRVPPAR